MGQLSSVYLNKVIGLLERIRDEEEEQMNLAAKMLADTVEQGNCIFAFGCTHSSLPVQDLVYRAGGLMLVNPLFGPGIASLDLKPTTISSAIEQLPGFAGVILNEGPLKSGDALIIVSVSGRNAVPVELAQLSQERGIKVIGITSKEYSQAVSSRHHSGKKMHDYADVVLDNKAPKGDAVLEDQGVPQKFNPVSGVTSTAILQALVASTIEELLSRGITPPIYLAANVDGGAEYNARLLKEYRHRIFYL
ncbi:MAG: SIS domain-containing protein [Bacillota bacterium]